MTLKQNEHTFSEFTLTCRFENLAFRLKLCFNFGDDKKLLLIELLSDKKKEKIKRLKYLLLSLLTHISLSIA